MGPSHAIFLFAGWIANSAHRQMDATSIWGAITLAAVGLWAAVRERE